MSGIITEHPLRITLLLLVDDWLRECGLLLIGLTRTVCSVVALPSSPAWRVVPTTEDETEHDDHRPDENPADQSACDGSSILGLCEAHLVVIRARGRGRGRSRLRLTDPVLEIREGRVGL
jgi:hypothetical protein